MHLLSVVGVVPVLAGTDDRIKVRLLREHVLEVAHEQNVGVSRLLRQSLLLNGCLIFEYNSFLVHLALLLGLIRVVVEVVSQTILLSHTLVFAVIDALSLVRRVRLLLILRLR
jgi:hypothetical protein